MKCYNSVMSNLVIISSGHNNFSNELQSPAWQRQVVKHHTSEPSSNRSIVTRNFATARAVFRSFSFFFFFFFFFLLKTGPAMAEKSDPVWRPWHTLEPSSTIDFDHEWLEDISQLRNLLESFQDSLRFQSLLLKTIFFFMIGVVCLLGRSSNSTYTCTSFGQNSQTKTRTHTHGHTHKQVHSSYCADHLKKSANRKAQTRKAFVSLTGLICAFRSADFLRWCLFPKRNLTHNLFFLFPIVFGINNILYVSLLRLTYEHIFR